MRIQKVMYYWVFLCAINAVVGQSALHPQWANDHEIVYYDRSGNVWSFDLLTEKKRRILSGSQPAPNPINPNLYAARSKVNGKSTIVITNVKTGKITALEDELLNKKMSFHPIWSKDGKTLAFNAENTVEKTSSIFTYDYHKAELNELFSGKKASAPSFFSNGDLLVSLLHEGSSILVRLNTKTEEVKELAKLSTKAFFVDPSPNGESIVYCSRESGNMDLWLLDIASGKKTHLTNTTMNEWTPRWSPSGMQIAYFVETNGIYQVWVMDKDGDNATKLNN